MKIADKYSPQNLGEVVYPNEAVKVRIQAYMSSQLEGHLLLWGPNGTGKTTVQIFCLNTSVGQMRKLTLTTRRCCKSLTYRATLPIAATLPACVVSLSISWCFMSLTMLPMMFTSYGQR